MPPDYSTTFNFTSREEAAVQCWMAAVRGMGEETGLLIPHVEALIDIAVDQTCQKIFASPDYLRLQNLISVTFSGGVASLSKMVWTESCFPQKGCVVTIGTPASWIADLQELFEPHGVAEGHFYSVQGSAGAPLIYAADFNGTAYSGGATILACSKFNFPDLLTTMQELKEDFAQILIGMAQAKIGAMVNGQPA